jgi:hypothetical protein
MHTRTRAHHTRGIPDPLAGDRYRTFRLVGGTQIHMESHEVPKGSDLMAKGASVASVNHHEQVQVTCVEK